MPMCQCPRCDGCVLEDSEYRDEMCQCSECELVEICNRVAGKSGPPVECEGGLGRDLDGPADFHWHADNSNREPPQLAQRVCDPVPKGDGREERDPSGKDQHAPGAKCDAGKVELSYLEYFPKALRAVCLVSMFGAKKYSRGGGIHVKDGKRRYKDAKFRHMLPDDGFAARDSATRHATSLALWKK